MSPIETTTTVDASTYWATVLGDLTESQAVEAHGLSTLSHSELMAWLETCEATARAAGATGLDDVHGLRWDAATALAAVTPSAPCARKVVTYRAPNGRSIDICPPCADRLTAAGEWPRNASGEYCQVSHGLHRGVCCYAVSE